MRHAVLWIKRLLDGHLRGISMTSDSCIFHTKKRTKTIVLSSSVVSDSLLSHGLQPTRLLCPWEFYKQEYWSGLPCSPPRDLPTPGIERRSPALQEDSLPSELPRKSSKITNLRYLFFCD